MNHLTQEDTRRCIRGGLKKDFVLQDGELSTGESMAAAKEAEKARGEQLGAE